MMDWSQFNDPLPCSEVSTREKQEIVIALTVGGAQAYDLYLAESEAWYPLEEEVAQNELEKSEDS